MRLWTLHPRYLDTRGLVALWREALLARAVLRGATRGYRHHPQLQRFRSCESPLSAIDAYLAVVYDEAVTRGYSFDRTKLTPAVDHPSIAVNAGQVSHEWRHLMSKLAVRDVFLHERWSKEGTPECHPLFWVRNGGVEPWER